MSVNKGKSPALPGRQYGVTRTPNGVTYDLSKFEPKAAQQVVVAEPLVPAVKLRPIGNDGVYFRYFKRIWNPKVMRTGEWVGPSYTMPNDRMKHELRLNLASGMKQLVAETKAIFPTTFEIRPQGYCSACELRYHNGTQCPFYVEGVEYPTELDELQTRDMLKPMQGGKPGATSEHMRKSITKRLDRPQVGKTVPLVKMPPGFYRDCKAWGREDRNVVLQHFAKEHYESDERAFPVYAPGLNGGVMFPGRDFRENLTGVGLVVVGSVPPIGLTFFPGREDMGKYEYILNGEEIHLSVLIAKSLQYFRHKRVVKEVKDQVEFATPRDDERVSRKVRQSRDDVPEYVAEAYDTRNKRRGRR